MHKFLRVMGVRIAVGCTFSCLLSLASPSQDVPLLKRIRDYWKEGDFSTAKKQISLYLDKHPNDIITEELHLLLGDLYLREGNFAMALEEYSLIQTESLQDKALYNQALCLYELGQHTALLSLTKDISSLTPAQAQSVRYLCACALENSQDSSFIDDAITLFEGCKETTFATASLAPLASLYLQKNETRKAAECYINLAAVDPDQRALLLYKAALLQMPCDDVAALDLLEQVLQMDCIYKTDAAYNAVILLEKGGRYAEVVHLHEQYSSLFSMEELARLGTPVANSLTQLERWEDASSYLIHLLHNPSLTDKEKVSHQLLLLSCAVHKQDISLYEETWDAISIASLDEELSAQVHLTYLNLARHFPASTRYTTEAQRFLSSYPYHAMRKEVHLALIEGLYETKEYALTHSSIVSFLSMYPGESQIHVLRLDLNCLSALSEKETGDFGYRKQWIALMLGALHTPDFFDPVEKESHLVQLGEFLFVEERIPEASEIAEQFMVDFPASSFVKQMHLLQTLCYAKDPESPLLFAMQAEKFLDLYPEDVESCPLHLQLFNVYLSASKSARDDLQKEFLDKAADHLYVVFEKNNALVTIENMQWLADYYRSLASLDAKSSLMRAICLLEHLNTIDPKEETIYKLSKLFAMQGSWDKQIALLERHASRTGDSSSWGKYFSFDLAKAYGAMGNCEKAFSVYDQIILAHGHTLMGAEATLERCKLQFAYLQETQKNENNPVYQKILDDLKDLENERSIATEPLHIEAGLEYVQCKCCLLQDPVERKNKEAELFTLCLEKLTTSYDVSSAEHSLLSPYISFLQDSIALRQATSEEQKNLAVSALQSLAQSASISPSLRAKIYTSLEVEGAL